MQITPIVEPGLLDQLVKVLLLDVMLNLSPSSATSDDTCLTAQFVLHFDLYLATVLLIVLVARSNFGQNFKVQCSHLLRSRILPLYPFRKKTVDHGELLLSRQSLCSIPKCPRPSSPGFELWRLQRHLQLGLGRFVENVVPCVRHKFAQKLRALRNVLR